MENKIKEYLKKNSLKIFLIIIIIIFFIYIFSDNFRNYLLCKDIDPNFLIGFLTAIALVLSTIQSVSDKRFCYNTNLVNSVEDKGIKIIAKLLTIRRKSEILSETIKHIKKAIDSGVAYLDSNSTLSKEDIEKEMEMTVAYIQTYFPEEGKEWNILQDKLSTLATNCGNVLFCGNVLLNYRENIKVLKNQNFSNITLGKIDEIIIQSENIYNEIDKSAMEMSMRLAKKINEYKNKLKDNFYFKL